MNCLSIHPLPDEWNQALISVMEDIQSPEIGRARLGRCFGLADHAEIVDAASAMVSALHNAILRSPARRLLMRYVLLTSEFSIPSVGS